MNLQCCTNCCSNDRTTNLVIVFVLTLSEASSAAEQDLKQHFDWSSFFLIIGEAEFHMRMYSNLGLHSAMEELLYTLSFRAHYD